MPKLAKSKTATDDTLVAPKDINGDVTTANELNDDSPRSSRKRAGDFNDFEDDEAGVDLGEKSRPSTVQPKKKSKTTAAAEKKSRPRKDDGHSIPTEKIHPGGDRVEVEPAEKSKSQKKNERKAGRTDKAGKKESTTKLKGMEPTKEGSKDKKVKEESKRTMKPKVPSNAEKSGKEPVSKMDSGKTDLGKKTDGQSSQAEAMQKIAAPHKPTDNEKAEAKPKPKKSKAAGDAKPTKDAAQAKAKGSKASKAAEASQTTDRKDSEPAAGEDPSVAPEQTMDQAPFKNLLKRERGKIPAVKGSAAAAEADRKAHATADTMKALGDGGKTSDAKESKPAESSKAQGSKGRKRKEGPEGGDTIAEAAPSEKKQKKSRKSALDVASDAVGSLVDAGIEAAAQGVSAVKDLASGLGNKSIADDVTEVAEGAAAEKAKEKRAKQKDRVSKRAKSKKASGEAELGANESGLDGSEDGDEDNFEEGDQTLALIKGFESEGDERPNDNEGFKEGMKMPSLPKSKDLTKKLKAAKEDNAEEGPGVIYVGRIPHGFYEAQMRAYFSQFGHILRLRLSRNRTTGASKHYAFIEFSSLSVANIVAETMNNYLLFGHILKCKLVPKEQVHENLWKGANKRFKKVPWAKIEGRKLEFGVGKGQWEKRVEAERKRRSKKGDKMKEIGYEFEAPEVKGVEDVKGKEAGKEIEEGTVEEKTLVTTDGGDGSMVISEEVVTRKTKKGGKRKVDEGPVEGAAASEVVKKAKKAKKSDV